MGAFNPEAFNPDAFFADEDPPPPPKPTPVLDAARGGPGQAPLRGAAWEEGTTDPDEEYPPDRTGGSETQLALTAEGWRSMIRRLRKHW